MDIAPAPVKPRRPAALFLAVAGFALLVVGTIWTTAIQLSRADRQSTFTDAKAEIVGAQKTIAAQVGRTAEAAIAMLAAVDTWLATHPADDDSFRTGMADLVDGMRRRNEIRPAIRLLDARGRTISLDGMAEDPVDFSARDYVHALKVLPPREFSIGLQVDDPLFGGAVIPVAMKARPNPLGVATIVTALPLKPLKDAFGELFISAPGTVGILRMDGYVLLRTPDPEGFTGRWIDRQRLVALDGEEGAARYLGAYRNPAGARRLIAYVQLPNLPLAVFASFAAPDIEAKLAPGERTRTWIAGLMTLAVIAISLLLAWLIHRRERQAAEVRAALAAAQAASESKSAFLANISHELRTPLNAIIGFSEMLSMQVFGPLHQRYRAYAEDVLAASRHLLGIVNQLLDMTAAETGRIAIRREAVELSVVIHEVAQMLNPLAAERRVEISVVSPPQLIEIETDRGAVRQALINLVGNAIKFCRPGRKVEILWRRAPDGTVTISVADEGEGISPESLPGIFEPFRQDKEPYLRREGGIGLGLPLTKRVVEALGGRIDVESERGKGSRFTVRLPERMAA